MCHSSVPTGASTVSANNVLTAMLSSVKKAVAQVSLNRSLFVIIKQKITSYLMVGNLIQNWIVKQPKRLLNITVLLL